MNLLTSAWVPVRFPDGSVRKLTPSDVPGSGAVEVAHPRADYSSLITEILVCLFQTLACPETEDQRLDLLDGVLPPDFSADTTLLPFFELTGDAARFLQAPAFAAKESLPAAALHFEVPTVSTVKSNNDFFVSRQAITPVCLHCAPVALFLNQSHARMGGTGYRTGPREVSVLTALLKGRNLWHTICLNLQTVAWFDERVGSATSSLRTSFPWMRPELFDRKSTVHFGDLGRFGVLWWMPVKLRLEFAENTGQEPCYACGEIHDCVATRVHKAATPAVLAGDTPHPHTGWSINAKTNIGRAQEVDQKGFHLEQWQALTIGAVAEHSLPAWRQLTFLDRDEVRLHVFGFALNQNKPLFWLDEVTPIVVAASPAEADAFKSAATALTSSARKGQSALAAAMLSPKNSTSENPELSLRMPLEQAMLLYWSKVTSAAIAGLRKGPLEFAASGESQSGEALMCRVALDVFDRAVECPPVRPMLARAVMLRRRKLAWSITKPQKQPAVQKKAP